MSTYIYLECTAHEPVIQADGESGQHLYDLPRLRDEIAHRDEYAAAVNIGASFDDRYTYNTARFLAQHPHCPIRIVDEYGNTHPLKDEDESK